jgi:hypothetical protein
MKYSFFCALILIVAGTNAFAESGYSHNSDYTLISGKLTYSDLEGGFWQINYLAPNDPADEHRGKFVLGNPALLDDAKDGEFVRLTGFVRPLEEQVSFYMAGTLYSITGVIREPIIVPDAISSISFLSAPIASSTDITVRKRIRLNAIASDSTGKKVNYTWDFGDGTAARKANVFKAYTAPGIYTILVKASNGTDEVSRTLTVTVQPKPAKRR